MPEQINIDLSLIISLAAFLLAGIGPAITALISGHYRIKEKKLELEAETRRRRHEFIDLRKADTIARYLSAAGIVCKNGHLGNMDAFGSSFGEIYLYVEPSLWPLIDQINAQLSLDSGNREVAAASLSALAKELSKKSWYY